MYRKEFDIEFGAFLATQRKTMQGTRTIKASASIAALAHGLPSATF